uniref:ribosomal protein S10 n=1 Tax=Thalassionema nitzschioides TaxID=33649 RepID=UPI001EE0186D|nr:ribosomal protein S10 [Thalassionema nitzschioides]UHY40724.1 ribosomal protein S10 [Thalassionema nitzschioides]
MDLLFRSKFPGQRITQLWLVFLKHTITLPNQKRIYCILRSPHVDKDSREHFEIRRHSRFVEIYYNLEEYPNILDSLMNLDLRPGVSSIIFVDPNLE